MAVLSPRVGCVSIVVGIIELVTAGICVIVGIIQVTAYADKFAIPGLWILGFGIPGGLSIVAGRTRSVGAMAVAVFFNIAGIAVSSYLAFAYMFWWSIHAERNTKDTNDNVGAMLGIVTIMLFILILATCASCLLGCKGIIWSTCRANSDPTVVTTTPAHKSVINASIQNINQDEKPPSYQEALQNSAGFYAHYYSGPGAPEHGVQNSAYTLTAGVKPPAKDDSVKN